MNSWLGTSFAALLLAAALTTGCGGKQAAVAPSVSRTASAPAAPNTSIATPATATAPPTETAPKWRLGAPLKLGPGSDELNLVVYIEQGCTACDGPPTALERAYRDSAGVFQRQALFNTPEGSRYMTSTAVASDGTLYATACFGDCFEVGSGIDGAGYAILYVSKDNGVTWNAQPSTPYARKLLRWASLPGHDVLLSNHTATGKRSFELFPSGKAVAPTSGDFFPVVTAELAEPILWQPPGGGILLYRPDGSQIAMPMVNADPNYPAQVSGAQPAGGLTLTWGERVGTDGLVQHFAIVRQGKKVIEFVASEAVPSVQMGAWLDDHRALGNVNSTPALFDFNSGEVRLIELGSRPPDDPRGPGRNRVISVGAAP